jgi:hypothetical protein
MEEDNKEVLDSTSETEEVTETTEETPVDSNVDERSQKLEAANKKLYARLKAAEEKLKSVTEAKVENKQPSVEAQYLTREEAILISKGHDEKDLDLLKVISKGKGVSLSEAINDEMFTAYAEKREKERKEEKAKLGASKSSGTQKDTRIKPGMSREEHMALFQKATGK